MLNTEHIFPFCLKSKTAQTAGQRDIQTEQIAGHNVGSCVCEPADSMKRTLKTLAMVV